MEYMMLRDSVRDLGMLQSLLVRPANSGYEVVSGAHRYEIAKDLKLETVPCIIKELTDKEALRAQVIENSNRIETRPIDFIRRLQQIVHSQEMSVEELAECIHKHPDWVRRLLSLNHLSLKAKEALDKGEISCKIGIELAKLPVGKQDELLEAIEPYTAVQSIEMLQGAVRDFRFSRKETRLEDRKDPISFRHFRKVKDEYLNRVQKATILTRSNATTASEGWDAAFEWILRCDEESLKERAANQELAKNRKSKIEQLRNLEKSRRQNDE